MGIQGTLRALEKTEQEEKGKAVGRQENRKEVRESGPIEEEDKKEKRKGWGAGWREGAWVAQSVKNLPLAQVMIAGPWH